MDFIKRTEILWKDYFFGDESGNYDLSDYFDPQCVIIGTGKHEFYTSYNEFSEALSKEFNDRQDIKFQFKDFWCEQKELSSDSYLTYGGLYIWWESDDKSVYINMDSRFSIIYKKTDAGWKIVHVHQSLPNLEQGEDEYYPKTLSEQMKKTQEEIDTLVQLAKVDSLTGLVNYRTLEEFFNNEKRHDAWIFVIDLDYFKQLNDTYGHVEGNHVLKKIGQILSKTVRSSDVVCRMGGDEFIIYCNDLQDSNAAEDFMKRVLNNVKKAGEGASYWISLSIGGTPVYKGESLETTLKRADKALYDVKANGKNNYKVQL